MSGCGSVWLERCVRDAEAGGSNPLTPTIFFCSLQSSIFAASYLLNFVILRMEDLALMSGTIVLAIILGVLMILTGKINRKEDSIR